MLFNGNFLSEGRKETGSCGTNGKLNDERLWFIDYTRNSIEKASNSFIGEDAVCMKYEDDLTSHAYQ